MLSMLTAVSVLFVCLSGAVCAEEAASGDKSDVALTDLIDGWPQMGPISEGTGLLIDADSGGVLFSLNRDAIRYPASTTKVLTALLVLENTSLKDVVTMTETGTQMAVSGSSNAGTVVGEQFTVEQCLYMLLLKSANDIANQLAEQVSGSLEKFAELMNRRAEELGCRNSHFTNPSGMPDSEHYTTAEDMALIMREAIKNETFLKIAQTETATIPPTNKTAEKRTYTNHNALLIKGSEYYYEPCIAGKTGYTDAAWRTYLAAAEKNGRTLVLVLMKGPDKSDFVDAAKLFEYGFNEFEKLEVPGGFVTLPAGKTLEDTTDETEDAGDGRLTVRFYYNQLPVGSAEMTEAQYKELRHFSSSGNDEKKDANGAARGVRTLIFALLIAAAFILIGVAVRVMRDEKRIERRERRREEKAARSREEKVVRSRRERE